MTRQGALRKWEQLEARVCEIFQALGCRAERGLEVPGARATHRIDVLVSFEERGFRFQLVVECKQWNRKIPKEKILALKGVVEDVGADKGVLISNRGFQEGALQSAESTNILLLSTSELEMMAGRILLGMQTDQAVAAIAELRRRLDALCVDAGDGQTDEKGRYAWGTVPKGDTFDYGEYCLVLGNLSILGMKCTELWKVVFPTKKIVPTWARPGCDDPPVALFNSPTEYLHAIGRALARDLLASLRPLDQWPHRALPVEAHAVAALALLMDHRTSEAERELESGIRVLELLQAEFDLHEQRGWGKPLGVHPQSVRMGVLDLAAVLVTAGRRSEAVKHLTGWRGVEGWELTYLARDPLLSPLYADPNTRRQLARWKVAVGHAAATRRAEHLGG